jgi:ribosomal protein S18 acetylase RimI-like enzyme
MRDVATFADLMNRYHHWLRGENLWDVDELRATLLSPNSDPVNNDRYLELDGHAVAAIHTHLAEPFDRAHLYLAAPPTPARLDHARILIDSGLRLLRANKGAIAETQVDIAVPAEDAELQSLVISLGFAPSRHVYILEAETGHSPPPAWPAGVSLRTLNLDSTTDLEASYSVFDEAFPPGQEGWRMEHDDYVHMLTNDPTAVSHLSTMVENEHGVVAACLNFRDTTKPNTGHVVMLGVRKSVRRQGIGKALLLDAFQRFRARSWHHARLGTFTGRDSTDLRLFKSVGMAPLYRSDVLVRPLL